MSTILQLNNIGMQFGANELFKASNLVFEEGKTTALVGANGTGKSTLLRIILGYLKPTKGNIHCKNGLRFSYVPDRLPKFNLSMNELLTNLCEIEGFEKEEYQTKLAKYYYIFRVESMIHTPLKYLSKGSLQKVAVIQALIGKYDILVLDEPLSGQDVMSIQQFISIMKELHENGVTIILSCHEPYLVDAIADKVYVINNRYWKEDKDRVKVGYHGEEACNTCVNITVACDQKSLPLEFIKLLDKNYVRMVSLENETTVLYVGRDNAQKILSYCIEYELEVLDLHREVPNDRKGDALI